MDLRQGSHNIQESERTKGHMVRAHICGSDKIFLQVLVGSPTVLSHNDVMLTETWGAMLGLYNLSIGTQEWPKINPSFQLLQGNHTFFDVEL